jgi:CubicO group peptidase (beta-lactamase class C family)
VEKAIQPIAEQMAAKYKCAVSISVLKDRPTGGIKAVAAAGVIDGCSTAGCTMTGTATTPDDKFVWGSVTKVLTGSGILRLVSKGTIKLSDSIVQ